MKKLNIKTMKNPTFEHILELTFCLSELVWIYTDLIEDEDKLNLYSKKLSDVIHLVCNPDSEFSLEEINIFLKEFNINLED